MNCKGKCTWIPINLPANNGWTNQNGIPPFYPSHGTPTTGPGYVWMWSYNNRGEGLNIASTFNKDDEYCIDTLFDLSTHNNQVPVNTNARARLHLTGS